MKRRAFLGFLGAGLVALPILPLSTKLFKKDDSNIIPGLKGRIGMDSGYFCCPYIPVFKPVVWPSNKVISFDDGKRLP
jgi:hypothetical protein